MPDISQFITNLSFQKFGLNVIDFFILLVIAFYAYEGFVAGFFDAFLDLASFILSFFLGLKFYSILGAYLVRGLEFSPGVANAASFFIIAFLAEFIFMLFLRRIVWHFFVARLREIKDQESSVGLAYVHSINRLFGLFTGMASAVILLSFILTIILTFPFSSVLKKAISASRISSALVANTQGFEKAINAVFGQAIDETISFFTIRPQSDELVKLNFHTNNVSVDKEAEAKMLEMVNEERKSRGLSPLAADPKLLEVARDHGRDMFVRGYFSHYTPEGLSPFDRLASADLQYQYAGENLALAPTVALAMQGLMGSVGHRKNILSPNYGRAGIGVIDGGIYGEMFVQEFRD